MNISVTVISAEFPEESPACLLGKTRTWDCPNILDEVVLESDETVILSGNNQSIGINMSKVDKDHYIVARLLCPEPVEGGANGPIMANKKLDGFWIQAAVDSYMWIVEEYEDGSTLWKQDMVTKNVPDTVDIQLNIIIAGVTFEDMTIERWITANDLDELGEYLFHLIRPESVTASACHTIKVYQDGVFLGDAYYSGILFPDDDEVE